MELLNFGAEVEASNVFLTWVTVCSVKGTSSPCRNKYVVFTDDTKQHQTKLHISERRGKELTLRATRCTTCCGSLSRITLREAAERQKKHSVITETTCCTEGLVRQSTVFAVRWVNFQCCLVLTYPPSTISSTARKSPSMFSNKALLSTFFLQRVKKMHINFFRCCWKKKKKPCRKVWFWVLWSHTSTSDWGNQTDSLEQPLA